MAPNITETIFALGCGDRLVGVTDFCAYPPEATSLPKVGGFFNPNLERLIALRPDLVVLQGKHKKVDAFCRDKRIPVLHVAMDSLSTIFSGIVDLGKALDASSRAGTLCNTIHNELQAVCKAVIHYPRQKVFISLGRTLGSMANLYTVGGSSFVSEILQIAGGENIFADVTQPYPEASKESLIKRAPDIILEMHPGESISGSRQNRILDEWNVFRDISAVSNHRVYIITEDFVLVPGPRVAKAARILAETLHGEMKGGS